MENKFDLDRITRKNIAGLVPYSSARDEYQGKDGIFLDANENAFGSPVAVNYNRYPDPLQFAVKEKIAELKEISSGNVFLGNGSDEAIDILFRSFCDPGKDNVIICPPTYGMYEVSAKINDVIVKKVMLFEPDFSLDIPGILTSVDSNTKLIFLCSPNNPTGNCMEKESMVCLLEEFKGLVVVDEAYADFCDQTLLGRLNDYPNLVILQTFSKAWGMAGLRVGMAFAAENIVNILNKVKAPYNISAFSQEMILEGLGDSGKVRSWIKLVLSERDKLAAELGTLSFIRNVYPSEANFILVKVSDAKKIYDYLVSKQVIVRDRSKISLCENCLRITIGTPAENKKMIEQLKIFEMENSETPFTKQT